MKRHFTGPAVPPAVTRKVQCQPRGGAKLHLNAEMDASTVEKRIWALNESDRKREAGIIDLSGVRPRGGSIKREMVAIGSGGGGRSLMRELTAKGAQVFSLPERDDPWSFSVSEQPINKVEVPDELA
jgi:hypothetical protein